MEEQAKPTQENLNEMIDAVDPDKALLGLPFDRKVRLARLLREMRKPYSKPAPRPRKPAPRGRAERVARKRTLQAASCQEHITLPPAAMVLAREKDEDAQDND